MSTVHLHGPRPHESSPAARINALVERFVSGQPLRDFQRDLFAFYEVFDGRVLPDAQRDAYWAVLDLVCVARPDPIPPEELVLGALGERSLRERLRHFHLRDARASGT